MRRLVFLLLLAASAALNAHELHYTAASGEAVVLRVFYADAKGFAFEAYEISRDGEALPVQVGRTDAQGRIAFLPDGAGTWRLKAFTEDGHGLDVRFTTDAAAQLDALDKPFYERHARILVGVGLIFGVFGLLSLFIRRKPVS